jgi:hypothetical protein
MFIHLPPNYCAGAIATVSAEKLPKPVLARLNLVRQFKRQGNFTQLRLDPTEHPTR